MALTLPWLANDNLEFPEISRALEDPNGLLAVGGDLSPERLTEAYRRGIFPWFEDSQPILWWSPQPRMILLPEDIHISRSLRKVVRSDIFRVTADTAFPDVVHYCAQPRPGQDGTWITADMQLAYCALHRRGVAHSLEVWRDNDLVGGIYGVAIGRAFFGESMFSMVDNASKVALVSLAKQLQVWGFGFIDCQMETAHLASMGAKAVPRSEFQDLLMHYTKLKFDNVPWQLTWHFDD